MDLYTKAVLTVIAVALLTSCIQNLGASAYAQPYGTLPPEQQFQFVVVCAASAVERDGKLNIQDCDQPISTVVKR